MLVKFLAIYGSRCHSSRFAELVGDGALSEKSRVEAGALKCSMVGKGRGFDHVESLETNVMD